jgi:hypothetical protein
VYCLLSSIRIVTSTAMSTHHPACAAIEALTRTLAAELRPHGGISVD